MSLPLASPMQNTLVIALPLLSSTSILSLTGTKPLLSVSAFTADKFRPCTAQKDRRQSLINLYAMHNEQTI